MRGAVAMKQETPKNAPGRVGVLIPRPLSAPYDYAVPEMLRVRKGQIVRVPLGPREEIGVVWGEASGAAVRLKAIAEIVDAPPMPADLMAFVDWAAEYNFHKKGEVLALCLRAREAFAPERQRFGLIPGGKAPSKMTEAREKVLRIAADGMAREASELAREAGVSVSVVNGLLKQGALKKALIPAAAWPKPDPDHGGVALSAAQRAAADILKTKIGKGFSATLLDGVTGAGKTETYFEAVAEALRQEKQVLILLPEIALTHAFLDRFARRFSVRPAEWHSDLTPRERRQTYRAVHRGEACAVVGARSALFLPYPGLGLIVVDEEHDSAFKQEEGLTYHARDMAVKRAQLANIPIVLSSATPSLETWENARAGRYGHVHLPERHGAAKLPQIELLDMRREPPADAQHWLSPPLVRAVGEALARKEQALVFLNRRGYAPLTLCRACGHRLGCPNCSAWLVEHKASGRLKCHHCDYERAKPDACPKCGVTGKLAPCGPGVERVAEELRGYFPNARIALATSDLLKSPRAAQAALHAMAEGATDILVGTQIVAKGHNFPKLTLAGVVDADLGLQGGDPRARERTFQLLHQVAGRAGRLENHLGRALVQTVQPEDPVMQALARGDRDGFLAQEAEARRVSGMPPFGRLAALVLSGADERWVAAAAQDLRRAAPIEKHVEVWGPSPAILSRLKGLYRVRMLVKGPRAFRAAEYLQRWLGAQKLPSGVKLAVDVDPMSFM